MIWCIKTYIIAYVKTQKNRFIIHYVKPTSYIWCLNGYWSWSLQTNCWNCGRSWRGPRQKPLLKDQSDLGLIDHIFPIFLSHHLLLQMRSLNEAKQIGLAARCYWCLCWSSRFTSVLLESYINILYLISARGMVWPLFCGQTNHVTFQLPTGFHRASFRNVLQGMGRIQGCLVPITLRRAGVSLAFWSEVPGYLIHTNPYAWQLVQPGL